MKEQVQEYNTFIKSFFSFFFSFKDIKIYYRFNNIELKRLEEKEENFQFSLTLKKSFSGIHKNI